MSFLGGSAVSNLRSFLHCTTPLIPSHLLPKECFRELNPLWHPWDTKDVECFLLRDLWSCYDEWSAYGAGTPVVLNGEETLVQYYVPYLSAIQIFTSTRAVASLRSTREDAESEMREFSDSWSDDSESDKLWRSDGGSSEDCGFEQESLWQVNERLGHLYLQYFERSAPYGRVPLMDKIRKLAQEFPGLMTLKSVDLSPASWMAVAWYPIYHIPTSRTVKDLSTCFLTYHTLSSSFQETEGRTEIECTERRECKGTKAIALPPFGVATYKMQFGSLWASGDRGRDRDRLRLLSRAADSWLRQLRVQHHDFDYFAGIRRG